MKGESVHEVEVSNDPDVSNKVDVSNDKAQLNQLAKNAHTFEHEETILEALRKHPRAVFWAFLVALTVVMDNYDTILLRNFFAYPQFVLKYGTYHSSIHGNMIDQYQVSAAWQSGLGAASGVGGFFGAFLNGYLVDRFGKKRVLISALITLTAFIFIVFFAPNLTTLLVGEVLCGVPWGIFATLSPAYASEVMPLSLRVYLTSYTQLW
jgi:SP family general alpha glucoside:H+ symporter-like MFS transporter